MPLREVVNAGIGLQYVRCFLHGRSFGLRFGDLLAGRGCSGTAVTCLVTDKCCDGDSDENQDFGMLEDPRERVDEEDFDYAPDVDHLTAKETEHRLESLTKEKE